MSALRSGLWQRFHQLPIFHRLLLGNSAVIIAGAIGGTLITHQVAEWQPAADVWLIGLFAALGILLSLVVNFWIVRAALRPVRELRDAVDQVQARGSSQRLQLTRDSDPDIRQLAAAVDSMVQRLEGRTLQLRALSERAITAQEDERKRIARGLHDGIGQALSTLIIRLERLEAGAPSGLRAELSGVRQLGLDTLDDLRTVVSDLRPTLLDDLGLGPAIRWYARSSLEPAGVRVSLDGLEAASRLAPQLETALYRIAQEAINNSLRHAGARSVVIRLSRDDGHICLSVQDDGRGFDVARTAGQALRLRHFGLLGIQERVELVGGQAAVESSLGRGTLLTVRIPLLGLEAEAGEEEPELGTRR